MASKKNAKKKKTRQPRTGLTKAQEAYCRAYVLNGGTNGADAVAEAMPHSRKWTPQQRAVRSSQLQAQLKIRERIAELGAIARGKLNDTFALNAEAVIARLSLIASSTLGDFVEMDAGGQPTITLKNATPAQLYGLSEIAIEDIESGRRLGKRTKIKLSERTAALRLLCQFHGLLTERVQHQHEHVVVIENAARELQQRLTLLSTRAREPVAEAEVMPLEVGETERQAQQAA